ncbi:lipopolysaccharide kinase InaA family protein [Flavobacteriaceae bacterium S0825]|uniref:lipopolysaccharide kinase InaA family protein n=1 Tax=Gaetbulibacter sp. S0825 TaxID=2720084 RepID=UPI001430BE91|nr:lipopolysaccharide kinase InaA family protein [Gaetbulibacter sp. S0825]MCK0108978.1 lipopolysaccharide kinase InaA family protein [Flavobacteriaceae bacterium S0825]NIX64613.1 Kdo domain containing protein [Gaetbulibacter sp. S0825]
MKKHFHSKYLNKQASIDMFIDDFCSSGILMGDEIRNSIKLFELDDQVVNIKSFKIPNVFNKIAYKFLRKSKAQRSFEYAKKLLDFGIGTPHPIAYYEDSSALFFGRSYYVSEQVDCDLTYRELIRDLNYPDHEKILREFTKFTFKLHENNVYFLDHSPGNTLIKKENDTYRFYLVDLNRMQFKSLSFVERIRNFERLTIHESMVKIMSEEYSKLIDKPYEEVFNLMWKSTQEYQQKFYRKRQLKKRLKFWKK